jgi:hypothetical protein
MEGGDLIATRLNTFVAQAAALKVNVPLVVMFILEPAGSLTKLNQDYKRTFFHDDQIRPCRI